LHHENFDGTGYPYGLASEKGPLEARVIRAADAFDAMTTDRGYRPALTAESAVKIVECGSGCEFDPRCAAVESRAPTWTPRTGPPRRFRSFRQ
jgi:HD-GYP domain-containing protein (c-di-GMP phosphodiesterase class II)